jgi:inactive STAND
MFSVQHLQQKKKELQPQYDILSKKIKRLREDLAIQAGTAVQFQLENEIERAEQERDQIKQQIEKFEKLENSEKIHNALLRLDYQQQVSLFRDFIEEQEQPIGAFLVHGESEQHGQIWLLKRLLRLVPDSEATPRIKLNIRKKSRKNNISALWRQLGDEVETKWNSFSEIITDEEIELVIQAVIKRLKTDHLILILHEVECTSEDDLNELICKFWLPLVSSVTATKQTNDFFLLMFLVDYEGCVNTWNVTFAEEIDSAWEPHIPISLPMIKHLSNDTLTHWIEHEFESLPIKVNKKNTSTVQEILKNSQEGVPEGVFFKIFNLCNCEWHEWRKKWLKL